MTLLSEHVLYLPFPCVGEPAINVTSLLSHSDSQTDRTSESQQLAVGGWLGKKHSIKRVRRLSRGPRFILLCSNLISCANSQVLWDYQVNEATATTGNDRGVHGWVFSKKSEVGRSVRWHAHVLSLPKPIVHIIAALGQIAGGKDGYNKCDFHSTGMGREQ